MAMTTVQMVAVTETKSVGAKALKLFVVLVEMPEECGSLHFVIET